MSDNTIALDKNFMAVLDKAARINPNLKIKPHEDYIVTLSRSKSMLMTAPIGVTLPREVNIYDLKSFLATTGLINSPVLDLSKDGEIVISSADSTVRTSYADSASELITNYIDIERFPKIADDDVAVEITISSSVFESVMKSARVRNASLIGFSSDGKALSFSSFNKLDSGQVVDKFTIDLGEDKAQTPFNKCYKLEHTDLDVLKGEGELTFRISKSKHMSVVNTESGKLLFIVLDTSSTYNDQ